jgi:CBS-domain-containing membrane protein
MASTAFLVFVNPSAVMAQPRRILGGHLDGAVVGVTFAILIYGVLPASMLDSAAIRDMLSAFAVGIAILTMALTNTEHAPAAGTTLGLVIQQGTLEAGPVVVFAALILAIIRVSLERWLRDLL